MKLKMVLNQVNQIERSKFLNCLDQILRENNNLEEISHSDLQLKEASDLEISELFITVREYFKEMLRDRLSLLGSQANLLVKILSRDGNCLARTSWVEKLYHKEFDRIQALTEQLKEEIESSEEEDNFERTTRLKIYRKCFETAFKNDLRLNRECRITDDERTILITLANSLNLSEDDVFAIENLVSPLSKVAIDDLLELLKDTGALFLSKRKTEVLVADEVVSIIHEIQNKELADKYSLRILRALSDAELSNVLRRHGMKARGVTRKEKIDFIIKSGISIRAILSKDIFSEDEQISNRKDRLKSLIEDLDISVERLGTTIEERISVIFFTLKNENEQEFKKLSNSGFAEMLDSLTATEPSVESRIRSEFEIEELDSIDTERLKAYSISPLDILYLYSNEEIRKIRDNHSLTNRGNSRSVLIEYFSSTNDKYIDHYELLAKRDLSALRSEGIDIKEAEVGSKFEDITRTILGVLGLHVDEELRKSVNTAKDKADLVLSIGTDDVIVGEVKSHKNGDYAKYSTTSRQVKSYVSRYEQAGKRVAQALIIAPTFSEDFIESAEMDTDINISLLEAAGLKSILKAYQASKKPNFSPKLLTKGGLLKAERIAASI